jgi:DNA-binding transcriptional LysR family regulator
MTGPMLDLMLLKSFLQIVRSGSLSAAASELGRTQSALSMQMQRLEESVGQSLLFRSGSGVRVTAAGERLLAHAGRLMSVHDEAMADLVGNGLIGRVRFGCPEDYCYAFVPGLLRSFHADHPAVEVELVCAPTSELIPLLNRQQIELAMVSLPDSHLADVIRPERLVWVGDAPEPAVLGEDVLPLALSAPNSIDHRLACEAMQTSGRRYRIAYASVSLTGLIAVARSGQAISVMTRTAVPPDLHVLDAVLPAFPTVGITISYSDGPASAAATALGQHVKRVLPGLRPTLSFADSP